MTTNDILIIEGYKQRISDLIDEFEMEIGCKIQNVDITPKQGTMTTRRVKFLVKL